MDTRYDAVLLIAFGGPTAMHEVRTFLQNVVRGRPVPPERLEVVVHHYELIGGGSPLNDITIRQARGLEEQLRTEGPALPVYVGMRNWTPYLHETLARMAADGVRRAVGVIMSPQQNDAGWGRYQHDVADARARVGASAPTIAYADEWHAHPLFIAAMGDHVAAALARVPAARRAAAHVVFTAHSIPTPMAAVSPYVAQVTDGAQRIAARLGHANWSVAYQSRSGSPRDPWLEPDICAVVRALARDGVRDLVAVPIGFVCDHVEVLYDLDIEARQVADAVGINFVRAAAANDHPAFIRMLADVVRQRVSSPPPVGRPMLAARALHRPPSRRPAPGKRTRRRGWLPRMTESAPHIVIVGGGIAGLAAAHRFVELGREHGRPPRLTLLEAGPRLGGSIATERTDGFVIEAGPDSFISEKPWALQLCERIGFTPRLVRTRDTDRRTFIVHNGALHALPDGFLLLAPTQFWPLLTTRLFSWPGKLRMGLDLVLPRGPQRSDESLASFVTRRMGREALERVAQPLVGGIYTADPADLSLAATMPRFLEMERKSRSIIWSMWSQMRRAPAGARGTSGARWSLFVSADDGMQSLIDALAQRLPEGAVRLGSAVRGLHREGRWQVVTSDGGTLAADAVVLATPAHQSVRFLADLDTRLADELRGIPYASSATVSLAYRSDQLPRPLAGFGFVVPLVEARSLVACTYSSVKYPGRAPNGHVLLRAFVGGAMQQQLFEQDDATMAASVRRELRELLGITSEPLLTRLHRHTQAMPQYRVGHLDRMRRIDTALDQHPGLALAGNAYRGVGIPDCIHSGEMAAETVWPGLGSR
jgi:protoporphyrinogen/coproporphyrinogen III oxidase